MYWIERHWQGKTALTLALFPLSLAFRAAVAARRALYRAGVFGAARLPVPVVVAGNISVGGTGKTPLVIWLADFLAGRGLRPGIVSRGYGRRIDAPRAVGAADDPTDCGDEPVMLAQRCDAPVWVGADRVATARALLAANPGCNVIISDDGLQHYHLARDIEIAVIDGARGLGNGFLLPAGPLREPAGRLATVDFIVVNVSQSADVGIRTGAPPSFAMSLAGAEFHNLLNPRHRADPGYFAGRVVHAVAAIGNPPRFFAHLRRLGLDFTAHPLPDHHVFTAADLDFDRTESVVMTEKDAVKCRRFVHENCWALRVEAQIDPAFGEKLMQKLGIPS